MSYGQDRTLKMDKISKMGYYIKKTTIKFEEKKAAILFFYERELLNIFAY